MNILYSCDDKFTWIMGVSLISLFESNKHLRNLKIFLLGENISRENKEKILQIGKQFKREVEIIDVPDLSIPSSLLSARWPLSSIVRLYSGNILPENIESILYIDSDTVVIGDLSEMEKAEFGSNIALGCKDCISSSYKKNIGLDEDGQYINSGVMLLNLRELRKIDINTEIDCFIRKYEKFINYVDQDIINSIFKGRIGLLSPKFNVMTIATVHTYDEIQKLRRPTCFYSRDEFEIAKNDPTIIHYTTNMRIIRPWFKDSNHPYASEFRKYLNMSAWKNKELEDAVFNSKDARVAGLALRLPKGMAYSILGVLHARIKPLFIRMVGGLSRGLEKYSHRK